jgi:FMN-dependent NADH-azoreductase
MKMLHIDSSIRGPHSVSRKLSAEIVERQTALHPRIELTYRDLAADPALHLSGAHVEAWAGGHVEGAGLSCDLETGEEYIAELFDADIVVIGAPMYNFSVPSQLKAWIDRIVVAGQTFTYGEAGEVQTLLPPNKKVFIASTRGNVYQPGLPTASLEHHESYLKSVLSFLGLHDVTIVRAEGLAFGLESKNAAIRKARSDIASMTG